MLTSQVSIKGFADPAYTIFAVVVTVTVGVGAAWISIMFIIVSY